MFYLSLNVCGCVCVCDLQDEKIGHLVCARERERVALVSTDRDYLKVQELFCKTLGGFDIVSIERIQNKELWEDFQT